MRCCSLPQVAPRTFAPEVSGHRARMILTLNKRWVNGTKLRYYFFTSGQYAGGHDQIELVREAFDIWENVGIGISFEEVNDISEAEVRIGFLRGNGSWSYVGRDVIDIPGQNERTMNFGWDLTLDPRGVDTPVHEIGHTLGLEHAHQNPRGGIVWKDDAVYRYFGGPPNNWEPDEVYYNILRKLSPSEVVGSPWDPNSVMQYSFPSGLILAPPEVVNGIDPEPGLSPIDRDMIREFYPPHIPEKILVPYRSQLLELEPGGQMNYVIEPTSTREYTLQTFGQADTVIVLFEDVDGDLRYVDGDDDSGTSTNARIRARLRKGKRYKLRVRLYLNYASGETAVMMW
ncbi:hypothetical protein C5Y93_27380 [Blastopirellula marina]|uniref:Peptidase metallopeptidase domain-containing protein n=1 Tax=Blastopirellula marina TaxID=124 RepID=A0A2S8GDZ5_9BACT|nr:hypothetical protein C5Y93_27380 [Blastopirellula marina]